MRRFEFRFQRILELKERMEEVRRAALGEAVGAFEAERRELEALGRMRGGHTARDPATPGSAVDAGLMRISSAYGRRLEREQNEQQEQVRLAGTVVEDRRQDLMDATRERGVFDILKERAVQDYRREVRRKELSQLDEIGQQLYLRQTRAEEGRQRPQ
ncbi:MAG: flagellar export protein FliJ [Candidatus Latescibacterota bacterium]|nr:flagellar export protein FliJ [Candidatus Latescibacterota bacterium]